MSGSAILSPAVWQSKDRIRKDEKLERCIIRDWKSKYYKEINDDDDGDGG